MNGVTVNTPTTSTIPGTTPAAIVALDPTGMNAGGPTPTGASNPNATTTVKNIANNTANNTANRAATTTPANALGERTHIIASGDTFGALAKKFYGSESKWEVIAKANPLATPDRLAIGQKIRIPANDVVASATDATTMPTKNTNNSTTAAANSTSSTHVVSKGETLSSISRKYYGSDKFWKQILSANKGTTEKNLRVGQKLSIPAKTAIAGADNVG